MDQTRSESTALDRTVYIIGKYLNITSELGISKAAHFRSALTDLCGEVEAIAIAKTSFRIICSTPEQNATLLNTTKIMHIDIEPSLPISPSRVHKLKASTPHETRRPLS
jgi:hypothetical protein